MPVPEPAPATTTPTVVTEDRARAGDSANYPSEFRQPSVAADVPEVVFGGSGFVRWTLGPVATIAGLGLLLGVDEATKSQIAWRCGVSAVLLLFAVALLFPRRCGFAARIVTALVFVACCIYVVDMAWNEPVGPTARRSASSLPNAIQALVMFGVPSLWFTLRGSRSR
jgi:hypothetical protein